MTVSSNKTVLTAIINYSTFWNEQIIIICYDDGFIMFQFFNSTNSVNSKQSQSLLHLAHISL